MAAPNTYTLESEGGGVVCVTHSVGNDVIVVAGGSAASNLTSNSSENVISASIAKVFYGSQGGAWIVQRVANNSANVTVGVFYGSGEAYYDGLAQTLFPAGNVNVYLVGTSNGFIDIDFHKTSTFS